MARRILDYDGTVVAAGGALPFGDIKDNPSGTRINSKSNSDLQQFFQKMMFEAGVTANSLADNNTNGYQLTEAMSKVIGNHAAQIVRMLVGGTYDPTKVYILWGCETRADGGYCLYDGELWVIGGNTGAICGGSSVDVLAFTSPTIYTGGVQALQLVCATSGSGIADFSDFIYLQSNYVALTSDDATWIDNPGDAPTCRKTAIGQVQLGGGFEVASSPADFQFGSIPLGFRPYKTIYVNGISLVSSVYTTTPLTITSLGKIVFSNVSDVPAVGGRIYLDGINYSI